MHRSREQPATIWRCEIFATIAVYTCKAGVIVFTTNRKHRLEGGGKLIVGVDELLDTFSFTYVFSDLTFSLTYLFTDITIFVNLFTYYLLLYSMFGKSVGS